ncbi:Sensor protein ZraS [compost metagenome]
MDKYGNQLFGLYKRFDTDVEGKGMGLFMVKTQIEDLGGSVQVQSEPEKGTTFHIVLPINTQG